VHGRGRGARAMTIRTPRQRDLFGESDNDPLVGLRVKLDRAIDRRQPCHDDVCEIAAGHGPHNKYGLLCTVCGQFRGWLPQAAAGFLRATIREFGVPDVPLIWRDVTRRGRT
jgi:hypothetical protein